MSLSPDPSRSFGRRRRQGRTLSTNGLRTLIVAAVLAVICARLFGAAH